ncbi:hypothetical protein LTS18_009449 [Coniosporium uncinatum]|uniref:Uncharacterized protein n=1 Tax=Coniosporium uncinatum TaxID=93489 RepID=A0ACC3DMJ9_9PEZI|nr:hypothetical protein LTS18_009449 [Coniosporium uncinatum]
MAISGWFHLPQVGEEGYEEGREEELAQSSSLAQLQAKSDELDLPQAQWRSYPQRTDILGQDNDEANELTQKELDFLLQYMRPQYLTPDTVDQLTDLFADESTLQLADFLSDKFSQKLRAHLEEADNKTDLSATANAAVKDSGIARPPHKHRFLYRQPVPPAKGPFGAPPPANAYEELIDVLFPSLAFKKWLSLATGLELTRSNVLGRRFRKGLDYTLATGYEEAEPQLEVCLGVTPSGGWDPEGGQGEVGKADEERMMWDDIVKLKERALGGYEMYMAADDEDEDEDEDEADADERAANGDGAHMGKDGGKGKQAQSNTGAGDRPQKKQRKRPKLDPAVYQSGIGDEEDGVLFSMPACWNSLSVVLRDKGVLKFVKYVSQAAKGDRWDVVGEFGVSGEDDGDDEEEGGEEQDGEQGVEAEDEDDEAEGFDEDGDDDDEE